MAEVVHIAEIKRRVLATKAKLSADSQDGPTVNTRLLDLLESVEKTLLHNQDQIRRLKRTGQVLAVFAILGWLATAALVADRFYGDRAYGDRAYGDGSPGTRSGTASTTVTLPEPEPREPAADLAASGSTAPSGATGSTQDVDDLILRPEDYQDRQVTVTGSVIQLFSRYRLRSETGKETIVIDIDGLRPADQAELEAALDKVGMLAGVRARILGRVQRQEAANFHLAASELVLLD